MGNMYCQKVEVQQELAKKYGPERAIKEIMEMKKQEELMEQFLEMFRENFFNDSDHKGKMFAHQLIKQHRTHQQSILANLFNALKEYAKCNYFDARNEAAMEWAKAATQADTYFPCI